MSSNQHQPTLFHRDIDIFFSATGQVDHFQPCRGTSDLEETRGKIQEACSGSSTCLCSSSVPSPALQPFYWFNVLHIPSHPAGQAFFPYFFLSHLRSFCLCSSITRIVARNTPSQSYRLTIAHTSFNLRETQCARLRPEPSVEHTCTDYSGHDTALHDALRTAEHLSI